MQAKNKNKKNKSITVFPYSYIIMTWFAFLLVLIRTLCLVLNTIAIAEEKRVSILNESQVLSIHVIVTNFYRNVIDTELAISSIAMHSCISLTESNHQTHIIWELGSW